MNWTATGKQTCPVGKQTVAWVPLFQDVSGSGAALINDVFVNEMSRMLKLDEVAATTGQNTMKWWVDWVSVDVRMKNQTNRDLNVVLYTLTPKRTMTTAVNGQTDWIFGLGDQQESGAVVPAGYASLTEIPGYKPTQSLRFCQNWTILKTHTFRIGEGAEHSHRIFLSPKYPFSPNMIVNGEKWFKGLTINCMAVVTGAMVNSTDVAFPGVTTSSGSLHFLASGRAKFSAIGKNRTIMTHIGSLPVTGVSTTEEQAIDDFNHALAGTVYIA